MRKRVHILTGICTCRKATDRQEAVRETWFPAPSPELECLFFLGGEEGSYTHMNTDSVMLSCPDDYAHLPLKVLLFMKYALEHYDFDWLFKCDDDTYVALERLLDVPRAPYGIIGDISLARRGAPSGGAGYFLRRDIVEQIVQTPNIPETGAEDLVFGTLARNCGAIPYADTRLNYGRNPVPLPNNAVVSCHWLTPERMRWADYFHHTKPIAIYYGKHRHWEDRLLFYTNGMFIRETSGCMGHYELSEQQLHLRWIDWNEEIVHKSESGWTSPHLTLFPILITSHS